jgi:cytidylate kinase
MAIITISRGSATGGRLLAEGLAKTLDFHIVSREEIIQCAAQFGVSESKLDRAYMDSPTFTEEVKQDRRRYLIFLQDALCEWARKDNVIYHGNVGHLLLRGISHLFRIRLIAPLAYRVQKIVERTTMTDEQAAAYIEKIDAQRRAWTLLLYGVDWLNPNLYDLTINLENMDIDAAVDIAAAGVKRREFAATAASQKAMNDLAFSTRIKATLAADSLTAPVELQVDADSVSGRVSLRGKIGSENLLDIILGITQKVPGVTRVITEHLTV